MGIIPLKRWVNDQRRWCVRIPIPVILIWGLLNLRRVGLRPKAYILVSDTTVHNAAGKRAAMPAHTLSHGKGVLETLSKKHSALSLQRSAIRILRVLLAAALPDRFTVVLSHRSTVTTCAIGTQGTEVHERPVRHHVITGPHYLQGVCAAVRYGICATTSQLVVFLSHFMPLLRPGRSREEYQPLFSVLYFHPAIL